MASRVAPWYVFALSYLLLGRKVAWRVHLSWHAAQSSGTVGLVDRRPHRSTRPRPRPPSPTGRSTTHVCCLHNTERQSLIVAPPSLDRRYSLHLPLSCPWILDWGTLGIGHCNGRLPRKPMWIVSFIPLCHLHELRHKISPTDNDKWSWCYN